MLKTFSPEFSNAPKLYGQEKKKRLLETSLAFLEYLQRPKIVCVKP